MTTTATTRPVYATVQGKTGPVRVAAQPASDNPRMIAVWITNGAALGFFKIERFDGERVTPRTLAQLFGGPAS